MVEDSSNKTVNGYWEMDGENEVSLIRSGGLIAPNLQIGADHSACDAFVANSKISCPGVKLHGAGFIVTEEVSKSLGLGKVDGLEMVIRDYRNGKDLTNWPRGVMVIDLFGLSASAVQEKLPAVYQHVLTNVKPERDQNNRDTYRLNWWIFGLKQRIRDLGERLDAHRTTQQALHPDLKLTGLNNVLEAVRAGTPLTAKKKTLHDKGLVSILKQIHDDLDVAVLESYGWQDLIDCGGDHRSPRMDGSDEEDSRRPVIAATILTRLVALNHARAAEEKNGHIHWLRPDYQNPGGKLATEVDAPSLPGTGAASLSKIKNQECTISWPADMAHQFTVIKKLLPTTGPDAEALSTHFGKPAQNAPNRSPRSWRFSKGWGNCRRPFDGRGQIEQPA